MKLFSYPPAPNPRRLQMFMAEKNIVIPTEIVDLGKGEQFSSAFKTINPESTVPVLITAEGETLTQVVAIVDYLEALHPATPLLGGTPIEKGLVREWMNRVLLEGYEAIVEVLRNTSTVFAHRSIPGSLNHEQIPALAERGGKRLDAFFCMLDRHLQGRQFIACDTFSMADIDAYVTCRFAGWIRRKLPPECTNLTRWQDAISKRSSAAE